MKSRSLLLAVAAAFALSSGSALADNNFTGGFSLGLLDTTEPTFTTVNFNLGYNFEAYRDVTITPMVRYGVGVGDDTLLGANVEVDDFVVGSVRASYHFNKTLTMFVQPSFAELSITARLDGMEESVESDWEFGLGGGFHYAFDRRNGIEFMYERFDDTDVFTMGYRYQF